MLKIFRQAISAIKKLITKPKAITCTTAQKVQKLEKYLSDELKRLPNGYKKNQMFNHWRAISALQNDKFFCANPNCNYDQNVDAILTNVEKTAVEHQDAGIKRIFNFFREPQSKRNFDNYFYSKLYLR